MNQSIKCRKNSRLMRLLLSMLLLTLFFACGKMTPCLAADSDFVIENGVLKAYTGSASKVTIPSTVTKIGSQAFCKKNDNNIIIDNTTLQTVVIPNTVTQIGYSAFEQCVNLKSVTIPDSVTNIQSKVFSKCTSLKSITLPNGLTSISDCTFDQCESLETVNISDTVTTISQHAFSDCKSLHSITLPAGLTGFGIYAFSNSGLVSVEIPNGVTTLARGVFLGCDSLTCAKLPVNLNSLDDSVFYKCNSLIEIDLPDTVTSMGNTVFSMCPALTRVHLPANLETIGKDTFSSDGSLLYIEIPEGVKTIGDSAFKSCAGLISVSLPSTLQEIGENAFAGCNALQTVIVPEGTTNTAITIKAKAFSGCSNMYALQLPKTVTSIGENVVSTALQKIYYTGTKEQWKAITNASKESMDPLLVLGQIPDEEIFTPTLPSEVAVGSTDNYNKNGILVKNGVLISYTGTATELTVPKIVVYIASEAFKDNNTLEKVVLQGNVYGIGASAFRGCTALKEVTLPKSLKIMGEQAFYGCEALEKIKLPEGINNIRYQCFYNCKSLSEVSFPTTLYLIGNEAFYNCAITKAELADTKLVMLDSKAFNSCTYLETCILPQCFRTMMTSAFSSCRKLSDITVPKKTKTIGYGAFAYCTSLSEFEFPDDITKVASNIFSYSGLKTLRLPEGVTSIGSSAFINCEIEEMVLPSTLTEIGENAFRSIDEIKALLLPESLREIGVESFYDCGIETIYIPAGLVNIGEDAFDSADDIRNIYYGGTEAQWNALGGEGVGGNKIFKDAKNRQVYFECDPSKLTEQLTVYHITYDFNGGEKAWWDYVYTYTMASPRFEIEKPAARAGYFFVGWKLEGSDADPERDLWVETGSTGDRHYIAQWTEEFTITYDYNGGVNPNNPTTYTVLTDPFSLKKPSRYEYTFLGWTGSNGDEPQLDVTVDTSQKKNLTFVAHWIKYYSIEYNLDGGKVEGNPKKYAAEFDDIILKNPTKEGTEFLGWMGDDAMSEPVKDLVIPHGSTGDRYYIAIWKGGKYDKDVYKIIYDLDDGTMEGNPESYTSSDPDIHLKRAYKENYEFIGWYSDSMFVRGTFLDPIIPSGSRGDLRFGAVFVLCDHEDMTDEPEVAATCTKEGHSAWRHCGCYKVSTKMETYPALGHAYDDGVITKEPTALEKGIKTYTCTRCKDTYTEEITALIGEDGDVIGYINPDGTISKYEISGSISANSLSVSANGIDGLTRTTSVGDRIGEGLWGMRKNTKFTVKNNHYKVTKTGMKPEVAFMGMVKDKKSVNIPAKVKYKGVTYKVTSIASKACMKSKKLRKVTIGKNVKKIGKKAFAGGKIKNLTIKSKLFTKKSVKAKAFSGIVARAKVKVPKGKKTLYTALLRKKGMPKSAKVK